MKQAIPILFCAAFFLLANSSQAQYHYPASRVVDSSDSYFGIHYKDPYRWLENMKDTAVTDWFKQQKEFAERTMQQMSGTDSFINQFMAYANAKTHGRQPQYKYADRYYYQKWERGQLSQNLYYKKEGDTTEHFIFDSWTIHPGMRYNLDALVFSPDAKYFIAAFDKNGEEYPFIKIYDVISEKWLQDSIPHCWTNTVKWTKDSKGFMYGYNTGERTAPNATENDIVRYHVIHTNYKSDITIMDDQRRNTIEKKISNSYYASVYTINGSQRIYCQPNRGFEFEYSSIFYVDSSKLLQSRPRWIKLCDQKDSVLDITETPSGYYFISGKGNGFKSLRYTSYSKPDFAHPVIIFPEDSIWQLENMSETKSYLLVNYSKYGFIKKTTFISKQTGKEIKVPAIAKDDRFDIAPMGTHTDECIFYRQYPNKPAWGYLLNIAQNRLSNESFWAPQGQTILEGSDDIVTELIEVPSYDGTLVPMSIMRNKNTRPDGSNLCMLYGYGAYGISVKDNSFNDYSPVNNLLIQRGVILAHAYVRGGGEKGEAWHQAGMKETKPNSWKDFIACAEFLTRNQYSNPAALSCYGGSAGGVLVGRTITERPDLFAAAAIQSGSMNQLRGKAWGNQVSNYPEYGNPAIESEMKGIIEMDAVIHVKPGVKYPAVYLTTGINDTRVAPWMPGKMAASLQANSISGKPVLLYTNFEGGHFGDANAPTLQERMKTALQPLFFLLWQSGHKEFKVNN
ncbi:MAG: prolyl oligopeptidase family serine peptidase [Ferruginibacter sp.]